MDEIMGTIKMTGINFEPRGYFFCDGRLLSISQYSALFALLGTTYGGNGTTNFALPNLCSRLPIGIGSNTQGLTQKQLGERAGVENVTLLSAEMPSHTHTINGLSGGLESYTPTNNFLPQYANTAATFYAQKDKTTDALLPMNAQVASPTGGNQPHQNMPPYIGLNFIICVEGIFPSRW